MSYRTILVHVDTSLPSPERVQLAAGLAHGHDAKLIGVAAGLHGSNLALNASSAGLVAVALMEKPLSEIMGDLDVAATQFESFTAGLGLRTEWRTRIAFPSLTLMEAATAVDLVIVGSCNSPVVDRDYRTVNPGDVLMGAGRPVLIVPAGLKVLEARNVLVAFKDTGEARRALADALPILQRARHVVVVNIREGRDDSGALADANGFLASHGIDARTEILSRGKDTIGARLMEIAGERNSDLIVAGAYGRSRFREWVFGGMTGELLANCPISCLLSH